MKNRKRICPICKKEYIGHPALSRKDNRTEICPECGMHEAIEAMKRYCIFEKKQCRYAENNGSIFLCTSPTDEDMECNK